MKKVPLLSLLLATGFSSSIAFAAPRKVLCENFTATWCTYCPDVANGLIMLMDEFPNTCFAMQVHGSDSYSTAWGDNRMSFYSAFSFPTVWTDGVASQVGSYGSPSANYSQLRSTYMQRIAVPTDVTLSMCGVVDSANTYSVTANVGIESSGSGKTMIIHCAQVLHNYPSLSFNYGCFKQGLSQTITLAAGGTQVVNFQFTLDSSSAANLGDVSFIAWAQATNGSPPSEVYQAEKHVYDGGDCVVDTFIVGPKGDFATITEALAAAGSGDSIQVLPGTYYENIDFAGSNVPLVSIGGPEVTIIDGGGLNSVVWIYSNESPLLSGFTIQNGSSGIGGGILCNGCPIIENCIIRNNTSQLGAGIFHMDNGSAGPTVSGTVFCGNNGTDIHGTWIDGGGNVFDASCGSNCPADVNADGSVNVSDLLTVIEAWGGSNPSADINSDGIVNVADLLEVVGTWGPC